MDSGREVANFAAIFYNIEVHFYFMLSFEFNFIISVRLVLFLQIQEAAIMAFGSILDGPDPQKLMPLVEQAMPLLVASMNERSVSKLHLTSKFFVERVDV